MDSTFRQIPEPEKTHDPPEFFNQNLSVRMPIRTSSSKIFPLRLVSTYEYKKQALMKREKKYKHIHINVHFNNNNKKRKETVQ